MPLDYLMPGNTSGEEETDMATLMEAVSEQNGGRLLSAGASAHEHFVQFGKILDLAYESDRKMVSLVEALGVREAASQSGHYGIPIAGTKTT